jgi:hypothetical protein
MADIQVKISTPQLDSLQKRLSQVSRDKLNRELAAEVSETARDHLRGYALSHHATADRLGGKRTGNLEDARIDAVSDSHSATITIAAKGIRRALGPLTITPSSRRALTIPIAGISYGRSVKYLKARGINIFRPKGKNYLATVTGKGAESKLVPLYILAKRVTLKHDPNILPSQATLRANALAATISFINKEAL